MTKFKIITRLMADTETAKAASAKFQRNGFPRDIIKVIAGDDAETTLTSAGVAPGTAQAYAAQIGQGRAVLLIRAGYRPLNAAGYAREMLAKMDTIDMGDLSEESEVVEKRDRAPNVLKDHPHILMMRREPGEFRSGTVSRFLGIPLNVEIRARKKNVMQPGGPVTQGFWRMPLVTRPERVNKTIRGHVSRGFWPMPLVSDSGRKKSVMKNGGPILSRWLGWKTIS